MVGLPSWFPARVSESSACGHFRPGVVRVLKPPIKLAAECWLVQHSACGRSQRDLLWCDKSALHAGILQGIPYAQLPTGSLRFAPPQPLNTSFDEPRSATEYGHIYIGYGSDTSRLVSPAGTKAGDDLPVAVWVHGVLQSYPMGGSRDPRYNLTLIVHQFVKEGKPIVAASINYRPEIQYNIAAFGGNRDKLTIWGESAGARSLGMQLVAYNGNDGDLFYSAILEGGSPVAWFTGCANASDSLDCLGEFPWQTLNDVFNSTTPLSLTSPTLTAVIDVDFITDQGSNLLHDGNFAHVPILLANNIDEGTAYANTGINTKAQFQSSLATLGLATDQIISILYLHGRLPREESKQVGKRVCLCTRDGSFVLGTSIDDKLYTIELRGPWSR
ncbi:hypothetical protein SUNI508_06914 [Seiridium unicorne]|uniref:Carboxylic ester hydrolase n=1 Tax=Seiridium unicorne TaxID=138068 RepID=A0ABR2UZR3_9PEZI